MFCMPTLVIVVCVLYANIAFCLRLIGNGSGSGSGSGAKIYPHMGMKVTINAGSCDWSTKYPFDIFHPYVWDYEYCFTSSLHWYCRLSSKMDNTGYRWIVIVMANQLMYHKNAPTIGLKPALTYKIGSPKYYAQQHQQKNEAYWNWWKNKKL